MDNYTNEMMESQSYTLRKISTWQGEINNDEAIVKLPSLQRGFVWKIHQIEALWDSIFRGYPIGAVLMSADEKNERLLLDGQQRNTSIALGFFNPYDENRRKDFFSLKTYLPSIWIDLQPKEITIEQKFVFRVLTKSHPWGYQIKENTKTLSMQQRRNAFGYFKEKQDTKSYIELLPSKINPWDSYYPVPLSFILDIEDAATAEKFKEELQKKLKNLEIQTQHSGNSDVNYDEVTDDSFKLIYEGLQRAKSLLIPEIQVKAEVLKEDDDTLGNESKDPTLFVRLNRKGTQISGEELIYSIYKAAFPNSKELVEEIGTSFIAPSKVINLFSRLAHCEVNEYRNYVIPFGINTFRKALNEPKYKSALMHLINEKKANELINIAIKIIKQNKDDFSNIILKQIIVSDIDLFFVLLAYINRNNFLEELSKEKIKEISANYVHILWFKRDKKYQKDKKHHNRLFHFLLKEGRSWEEAANKLIEEELLLPIVEPNVLRENLLNIVKFHKNYDDFKDFGTQKLNDKLKSILKIRDDFSDEKIFGYWYNIVSYIRGNKTLLLYAQRNYINEKFKEFNQIESIEDTNRPWDYDHIYPISWVYNKESINLLVRNWVNTIGNFRALSYDDNRSESNIRSPQERLKEDNNKHDSFIKDNDLNFWDKLDHSSARIKHQDTEKTKIFISAVIHRMCNIYCEWHSNYYEHSLNYTCRGADTEPQNEKYLPR